MPTIRTDPAHISVAGLKARGWTAALIRTLLGEPDTRADNPHYRKAAPMRLYLRARVEAVEASEAWQAALTTSAPRKAAAAQAVETKRQQLLTAIQALHITVPVYPEAALTARACAHYNTMQQGRDIWEYTPATSKSDPAFLLRITVNYLRHALTSYDAELERVFGKVGVREAYTVLNQHVYAAIAEAYPHLADECARQRTRKRETEAMREAWRH
jgi:hypothetical protein